MNMLTRRILAALTGTCAAVMVFTMVLAVSPSIGVEESPEKNLFYVVETLDEDEMEELKSRMDQDTLAYIVDTLVEDNDVTIVMSYLRMAPEFEDIVYEVANQP